MESPEQIRQGESPHGEAPVYLHEIIVKCQTAFGARPLPDKPTKDGPSTTLRGIPVVVLVQGLRLGSDKPIQFIVNPAEWHLFPNSGGEVGKFVMKIALPSGYRIVNGDAEAIRQVADAATTEVAKQLIEVAAQVQEGLTTEQAAIAATRAAQGLPPETDAAVFAPDLDKPAGFGVKGKGGPPNASDQGGGNKDG